MRLVLSRWEYSFVISAWEAAGVDVKVNGASSTSNMCDAFLKTGFTDITSQVDFSTGSGLEVGDVLWVKGHTCMYVVTVTWQTPA